MDEDREILAQVLERDIIRIIVFYYVYIYFGYVWRK